MGSDGLGAGVRVSTLELFFDLVFVFALTQLAETLADRLSWAAVGDTAVLLGVLWWMYSGYAWLTNAVAPSSTTRRTLLLTGMAGFLVIALAVPEAYRGSGWLFGAGYLVVSLAHTALFRSAGAQAARGMRVLGPVNLVAALLVLAGGLAPAPWRHVLWIAGPLVQIGGGYLRSAGRHAIAAGHFVERHGLVVIVAIGESIIAIGLGFREVRLGAGSVLVAVLGLGVAYYLWWFYFARDDARAGRVLAGRSDPVARARLAVNGWGHAHYPMMLGIVILAAGIKTAVGHAFDGLTWGPAVALGGGVALYLLGHAAFLGLLGLRGAWHRTVGAILACATILLGHESAVAQLGVIVAVLVGTAVVEDFPDVRRTGSTAIGDFGRTVARE